MSDLVINSAGLATWYDNGNIEKKHRHLYMLDHPITGVLNVLDTLKNNRLKVYKLMSIQT